MKESLVIKLDTLPFVSWLPRYFYQSAKYLPSLIRRWSAAIVSEVVQKGCYLSIVGENASGAVVLRTSSLVGSQRYC